MASGKGKDKKKDKDSRKDKKRKRDKDDEDEAHKRQKAEKLARKLAAHLKKQDTDPSAADAGGARFVWQKKIEKDLGEGADVHDFSKKAQRRKQQEREEEIAKVQRRREEREREKEQQEEELAFIQRERAIAEGVELDKKEELFHLEQAKMRTQQRLAERRPKPIDQIVRNLYFPDADFEVEEVGDPYTVTKGLTLGEVRELRRDVQNYQELDTHNNQHVDFWNAMATVAEHELQEAARQEEVDRARVRGEAPPVHLQRREAGWHASIDADVSAMLAGKTLAELVALEQSIEEQLDSDAVPDPEYWTAVLSRLRIWKARAWLRELHGAIMARQLAAAEARVDIRAEMGWDADDAEASPPDSPQHNGDAELAEEPQAEPAAESPVEDEDAALERLARPPDGSAGGAVAPEAALDTDSEGSDLEENVGQWSPPPLDMAMVTTGQDVVHEDDDTRLLDLLRAQVKQKEAAKFRAAAAAGAGAGGFSDADRAYQQMVADPGSQHGGVHPMMRNLTDAAPQRGDVAFRSGQQGASETPEERAFRSQAARMMSSVGNEADDLAFGGEIPVESQVYWWHEKYKPRKPKYFNRVHTGYEWNKYNQTHYDHDNPPPKTVQGYKFNIFYPDLIDKSEAPTYGCETDPGTADGQTCVLRFHAGPPYEDLVFRIVNKEWEYSHKRGFKSTFERGILHLYFNFKRARYRR